MNKKQNAIIAGFIILGFVFPSCSPSEEVVATETSLLKTEKPISTNTPQPIREATETPEPLPALSSWNKIPIPPDAISGSEEFGDYQFITASPARIITAYYKQEMANLGWEIRGDMMASTSSDLVFIKEDTYVFFLIKTEGDKNIVYIHLVQS